VEEGLIWENITCIVSCIDTTLIVFSFWHSNIFISDPHLANDDLAWTQNRGPEEDAANARAVLCRINQKCLLRCMVQIILQ